MDTKEWQELMLDASDTTVSDTLGGHPKSGSSDDGMSVQGCASPSAASSSSSPTSKKKKHGGRAPRSTNISRERRKRELEYLRALVSDLQTELTSLQERRDDMLRPHLASGTGAFLTNAPVWEGLAKRQFQASKKAEAERERLRTLLSAQTQVAEDLINVIQRARKIQQDVLGLHEIPQLANETVTVQEQLMRLRILCGQWFVAFSWCAQLQTGPMRDFESRVVSDDGIETVIDIYSTQAFPFTPAQVEHALWITLQTDFTVDEFVFSLDCEASEDTLITKFTVTSYRDGARATVKGTYVTRRYLNDQGHYLMASNMFAAPEIPDVLYPEKDFVLTEDTWVRIIDAKELSGVVAAADSNSTLTVLQHVRRSRIRFANADNHVGGHRLQTLIKLHLSLVEANLRWNQQNIESFLMRNSMSTMSLPVPVGLP